MSPSSTDFLLIIAVYDESGRTTDMDVSGLLSSNMQDTLARMPGVGDVNVFGAPYAMRIWLDPAKLRSYSLMPATSSAPFLRRMSRWRQARLAALRPCRARC